MMKYIYKKILSILPVGLFIAVLSFSSCEELKFGRFSGSKTGANRYQSGYCIL